APLAAPRRSARGPGPPSPPLTGPVGPAAGGRLEVDGSEGRDGRAVVAPGRPPTLHGPRRRPVRSVRPVRAGGVGRAGRPGRRGAASTPRARPARPRPCPG